MRLIFLNAWFTAGYIFAVVWPSEGFERFVFGLLGASNVSFLFYRALTYLWSVARTAWVPAYNSLTIPSICSPKPAS